MQLRLLASLTAAALVGACASAPAPALLPDAAARAPQLSTFARLAEDAGLGDTLRQAGPYTVFAPSDTAFKAVPAATMQQLASDKALLRSVLSYHVVPGRTASAEVQNGPAKTLQGAPLALSKAGPFVTVEDAVVTQADLPAANGVVHVIDRVLMPPKR
jgi:uncharacterized surface protein with fasciclin (FAS1) repeats